MSTKPKQQWNSCNQPVNYFEKLTFKVWIKELTILTLFRQWTRVQLYCMIINKYINNKLLNFHFYHTISVLHFEYFPSMMLREHLKAISRAVKFVIVSRWWQAVCPSGRVWEAVKQRLTRTHTRKRQTRSYNTRLTGTTWQYCWMSSNSVRTSPDAICKSLK